MEHDNVRIRTRPLLPKHENNDKAGLVEHLLARASRLELRNHWHLLVAVEVSNNLIELLDHFSVLNALATHMGERFGGIGESVLLNQPAGRLVHK